MELTAMRCRISDFLSERSWSFNDLSERTGIAKSTLHSYDSMVSMMPVRNAILIAAAFEKLPEELYVWNIDVEEILRRR